MNNKILIPSIYVSYHDLRFHININTRQQLSLMDASEPCHLYDTTDQHNKQAGVQYHMILPENQDAKTPSCTLSHGSQCDSCQHETVLIIPSAKAASSLIFLSWPASRASVHSYTSVVWDGLREALNADHLLFALVNDDQNRYRTSGAVVNVRLRRTPWLVCTGCVILSLPELLLTFSNGHKWGLLVQLDRLACIHCMSEYNCIT